MYRPMTPIDTTAVNATVTPSLLPLSAGRVRISAAAETASTALNGILLLLTRLQRRWPGTASSRLKAYIMREALVMQLMPQNICPKNEINRMNSAHPVLIALVNTLNTLPAP